MMRRKFGAGLAVAAFTLVGSVGVAVADRMPGRSYGAPCCFTWSGFYIGGHLGGAWSDVEWGAVSLTGPLGVGEPVKNDGRGFIGGGQIGYNLQVGNVVLGIEGTLSHANLDDDHTSIFNPFVTYSTDINWIGTVAGRLGVAHDRVLAYVKAGWATANIELSGTNTQLGDAFSGDDRRNGWVVGGGLEYMFSRNLSFGVEYNYIDLGSASYAGTTRLGIPFTIRDVDMDVQSVTARVNFRFGGDHARPLK